MLRMDFNVKSDFAKKRRNRENGLTQRDGRFWKGGDRLVDLINCPLAVPWAPYLGVIESLEKEKVISERMIFELEKVNELRVKGFVFDTSVKGSCASCTLTIYTVQAIWIYTYEEMGFCSWKYELPCLQFLSAKRQEVVKVIED